MASYDVASNVSPTPLGTIKDCPPRHPHAIELSFLELHGILQYDVAPSSGLYCTRHRHAFEPSFLESNEIDVAMSVGLYRARHGELAQALRHLWRDAAPEQQDHREQALEPRSEHDLPESECSYRRAE
jgi:hypothetical protein